MFFFSLLKKRGKNKKGGKCHIKHTKKISKNQHRIKGQSITDFHETYFSENLCNFKFEQIVQNYQFGK